MSLTPRLARHAGGMCLAALLTAAPGLAQNAPPDPAAAQEIHFDPDEPGLRLLTRTGAVPVERVTVFRRGWWYERSYAPLYAPLCDGPCVVRVSPGRYEFALAKGDRRPVGALQTIVIDGPVNVHGTYVDRSGLRAAGVVVDVAGALGGAIMILASVRCGDTAGYCSARASVDEPLLGGGIGVLVASTVLGSVLLMQRDAASFAITPLSLLTVVSRSESTSLVGAHAPQGAALALRF